MRKRNILLFLFIVVAAIVWGLIYWNFVVPIIDPR